MRERRPQTAVVVVGAGRGRRLGGIDKPFLSLAGEPLLAHSIKVFEASPLVNEIVLVVGPDSLDRAYDLVQHYGWSKVSWIRPGGERRQDSVWQGLAALSRPDLVAIHDSARPFVTEEIVGRVLGEAVDSGAAIAAVPVKDTVKVATADRTITATPDRQTLWAAQTPQVFHYDLIVEAYRRAHEQGLEATDDAQLVERLGHPVKVCLGSYENIKITTPEDVVLAEMMLSSKHEPPATSRVGLGYDAHALTEGRKLVLGGVEIPHSHGLSGWSDADVAVHALMDALLGASSLGDIGQHFPPGDRAYEGISSLVLLQRVACLLAENDWAVANVDLTVIAERPKLSPYIARMVEAIAATLEIGPERVSVKATTTEGLGYTGRGEGIAAQAVCLLEKRN
jgi:2-C-methyl-D-erythritol 4-phosphate cytidylyltransferase / 2-C-methyl-D-erythritol 2,4-cyclodiphosphate synthase